MNYTKAPFIILVTTLLSIYCCIVGIIYFQKTSFWADEIIALDISKQNISEMLDTIHSEPHPLGLYLTLKTIQDYDPVHMRIAIVSIYHVLVLLAIYVAHKSKILFTNRLYLGVLLFILSFGSTTLGTNIKQDFISAPLFMLSFFLSCHFIETKSKSTLIALTVDVLLTLFFGYLNFVKSMLLLFIVAIKTKSKSLGSIIVGLSLTFLIYFYLLGFTQVIENKERFRFLNGSNINLVTLLNQSIAGPFNVKSNYYLPDIIFLLTLFLASKFIMDRKTAFDQFLTTCLIVFTSFNILFSPLIRVRYMFELSFFILLAVGSVIHTYILEKPSFVTKSIFIGFLSVLFFSNFLNYYFINEAIKLSEKQNIFLSDLVSNNNERTGILERHPDGIFIKKIWFFPKNTLAVPVDPFVNNIENYDHITRLLLNKEGGLSDENSNTIFDNLKSKNLSNFIYFDTGPTDSEQFYYDPERKVPAILSKVCADTKLIYKYNRLIIDYKNCNFTQFPDKVGYPLNPQ